MKSTTILFASVALAILVLIGAVILFRGEQEVDLPIKIEQYADFNCPGCRSFHDVWNALDAEYGGSENVELVAYNHPILGASSFQAAFAAEAAALQGFEKEYADLLFDNFDARSDADYEQFAQDLGMDLEQFNQDREDEVLQERLIARVDRARENGITSTPTVFVSGRRATNIDFDSLKENIDKRLEQGLEQAGRGDADTDTDIELDASEEAVGNAKPEFGLNA